MTDVPWTKFTYSLSDFPFPDMVATSIYTEDLTALSLKKTKNTWQTDQQSPWHDLFYQKFNSWQETYIQFIREEISPLIGEPYYYQKVPTFRIHLPDNIAVGEFHTDAMYHHPLGEESFWLPLTEAYDTCSLWIEDDEKNFRSVKASPGEVIRFSAVTRLHGNKINIEGRSRVSFDFRCLPVRLLPKEKGKTTMHTKLKFSPGGYYSSEVIG